MTIDPDRRQAWHAGEEELAAYESGRAHRALASSIEAHLLRCADCRAALARRTPAEETEAAWQRLADRVDRPGHWLTRSVVATPTLLLAAAAAVVLVGVVPLASSVVAGDAGLVALLVLAPLAPVAAVAIAYRDRIDPAGEIGLAAPGAGLRLVALRALLVSLAALPLALLATAAVDRWVTDVPVQSALAWCLPGLALASLVLAAGTTRLDPAQVAGGLSATWAAAVVWTVTAGRRLEPEAFTELVATPAAQSLALAVALAALAMTALRRDTVSYRRIP